MKHPLMIDLHTDKFVITLDSSKDEQAWIESIHSGDTEVSYIDLLLALAAANEQEFDVADAWLRARIEERILYMNAQEGDLFEWYRKRELSNEMAMTLDVNPYHWTILGKYIHTDDMESAASILGVDESTARSILFRGCDLPNVSKRYN